MRTAPTYTIVLSLLLVLTSCGESDRPPPEIVVDDLGRTVRLDVPINRVATLAPNLTEIVFAVGAGSQLVGVGIPDTYPPNVDTLPRYSTYPVDFEAIAAIQPDLVLATDQVNSVRSAETLEQLGIPTFFLSFESYESVFQGMLTIGELLGTSSRANAVVDSLRRATDMLKRRTYDHRPRVIVLVGPETLYSFGEPSYVHEVVDLAGGTSITQEIETAAPILSEEYVIARAPDVILGPWGHNVGPSDLLEYHPTWVNVPAIRNDRVVGLPADLLERPGPRLVEGAIRLARLLHPDSDTLNTSN